MSVWITYVHGSDEKPDNITFWGSLQDAKTDPRKDAFMRQVELGESLQLWRMNNDPRVHPLDDLVFEAEGKKVTLKVSEIGRGEVELMWITDENGHPSCLDDLDIYWAMSDLLALHGILEDR